MPSVCGCLRYPMIVERVKADATETSFGQVDLTDPDNWETHAIWRFGVTELSGREVRVGDTVRSDISHQLVTWYDPLTAPTLKVTMRVKWEDGDVTRYLNIEGITAPSNARRRDLVLLCKEKTDG